ncbi:hypothetical protein [Streptomyces sp. AMCC400023]|uniref:hypothetical protein n=1 Tax=Streptomyces sp. AMCC400023 TaxID=2056258 RepID=UPI001F37754E|nr:hypothetical protein [Streptomyces sp. AMCC400023]UJV42937.1 hypothetical protein CVT30_26620 [Streptomyces sp. AMCC400023]
MQPLHLTPEQIAALNAQRERVAEFFRQLIEGFRELVRQVSPVIRAFADYVNGGPVRDPLGLAYQAASGTRRPAPRRPAWVSPYGPAPRRH